MRSHGPGLSKSLRSAFPDLALSGLHLIDLGFGSMVVETGDGVILRIGRTQAAAKGHAVEAAVLPVLAPLLPAAVPVPEYLLPADSRAAVRRHRVPAAGRTAGRARDHHRDHRS